MKRDTLVNSLAICGAASVVAGIGLLSVAAGIIALGVLLIVGAVAVARVEPAQTQDVTTKAKQ